jgi:hypothetical protein
VWTVAKRKDMVDLNLAVVDAVGSSSVLLLQ